MTQPHHILRDHYEKCLETHGDTHLGVDWPRASDAEVNHQAMLDLCAPDPAGGRISVLDFGCGTAHFLEYIRAQGRTDIDYAGLDISPKFIEIARQKHPDVPFYCLDVLEDGAEWPEFDYIVMSGVFTARREMTYEQMTAFWKTLLGRVFPHARRGLAFNAMSKHVDWEREYLYHLPFDEMAHHVRNQLTRRFTIRHDLGVFDYVVYMYK